MRQDSVWQLLLFPVAVAVVALGVWWEQNHTWRQVNTSWNVMGTVAHVHFGGVGAEAALEQVVREIVRVEECGNLYNAQSELSRLNASAADEKGFVCSELLWAILQEARLAYENSHGVFDISSKPLMDLWGFYQSRQEMPQVEEVQEVLSRIGLDKVEFDDETRRVKFTVPGMALDLGGIAKGIAVDLAAKKLENYGIRSGVVNLGGNLLFLPEKRQEQTGYRLRLRNPLNRQDMLPVVIKMHACGASTSGGYERYRQYNGKRYAHVMNPITGMPAESQLLAATVLAPSAGQCDWMSTAIFVGGKGMALELQKKFADTRVILYWQDDNEPNGVRLEFLPSRDSFSFEE